MRQGRRIGCTTLVLLATTGGAGFAQETAPSISLEEMANRLAEREWDSVAIIDSHEELGDSAQLAARNLNYVELLTERGANVYSLLKRRELVLTKSGLDALTARLLAPIAR